MTVGRRTVGQATTVSILNRLTAARIFNIMIDNFYGLPIPLQVRRLRQRKGLTLEEAAALAGTSAPTLHRYESGWNRFEIRTLERIGRALGAGLEVRFVPNRIGLGELPTREELVRMISPLFWDADLRPEDLTEYAAWVLGRVLHFGSLDQVRAVRAFYGDDAVVQAVARRGVDARTRAFWEAILGEPCIPRS